MATPRITSVAMPFSSPPPLVSPRLRSFCIPFSIPPKTSPRLRGSSIPRADVYDPVFAWPVNWTSPVQVTREWLTDILNGHDGTEQRVQLRALPRVRIEGSFLAEGYSAQRLDALLFGWQHRELGLPWWPLAEQVVYLPEGEDGISVVTPGSFVAGERAVLISRDPTAWPTHEVLDVLTVGASTITVNALRHAWAAAVLAPLRTARLSQSIGVSRITDALLSATIEAELTEDEAVPAAGSPATYQGHDVAALEHNWTADLAEQLERAGSRFDTSTGLVRQEASGDHPAVARTVSLLLDGRVAIESFRSWSYARAGRLSPFWLPSHTTDLTVSHAVPAGERVVPVRCVSGRHLLAANTLYTPTDGGTYMNPARRDVSIYPAHGGTPTCARVQSISRGPEGVELLKIDTSLADALVPGVSEVRWLSLCRLAADAVTTEYLTDAVARVRLGVVCP